MIRYFFRLLKGYVRIQIKSISPEYFLERCRINGIFFWERGSARDTWNLAYSTKEAVPMMRSRN